MPNIDPQPVRWYVTLNAVNPATGQSAPIGRCACRDKPHACTVLTELRELLSDLALFVPTLTAVGYELVEEPPRLETFAEALEASETSEEDKAFWREEIAQGRTLGNGQVRE